MDSFNDGLQNFPPKAIDFHKADEWYLPRIRIIDRTLNIFPFRIPTPDPISTSLN